jgi:predicted DNA-binding transcriptional regulator YafY
MRTTFDLLQELLWNGGDVEVLESASLRREMAEMVERMWNKYKNDKK